MLRLHLCRYRRSQLQNPPYTNTNRQTSELFDAHSKHTQRGWVEYAKLKAHHSYNNHTLTICLVLKSLHPNVQRGCTFCMRGGQFPIPDELYLHVLYECRTATYPPINRFLRETVPEWNIPTPVEITNFIFYFWEILQPNVVFPVML